MTNQQSRTEAARKVVEFMPDWEWSGAEYGMGIGKCFNHHGREHEIAVSQLWNDLNLQREVLNELINEDLGGKFNRRFGEALDRNMAVVGSQTILTTNPKFVFDAIVQTIEQAEEESQCQK